MTDSPPTEPSNEELRPSQHFFRTIAGLSRTLDDGASGAFSKGDIAALRREDGALSPTFYKVAALQLERELAQLRGERRDEAERRWARAVHLLARTAGLHTLNGPSLGDVVAHAGLAEARFVRLLRAEGQAIEPAARSAIAPLLQKAARFDPRDLVAIVLSTPHPTWGFHFEDSETVRRRVARDYYRGLHHAESHT